MRLAALLVAGASGLALATPAHALTPWQRIILSGAPTTPQQTAPSPNPGADAQTTFLGYANMAFGGAQNNGITLPAGATYVPGGTGAWVWVEKFRYDDQAGNTPSGGNGVTLAAACAAATCSAGNDRVLQVVNPYSTATRANQREVSFSAKRSSNQLWTAPGGINGVSTGIHLSANTNYCIVIAQYTSGAMSISVNDSNGAVASGSPAVQTAANNTSGGTNFYYPGTGTPVAAATIANVFSQIGTAFTTTNAYQRGAAGPIGDVAFLTGQLTNSSGTPDAAALASLCNGTLSLNQWATAQSLTITSHYPLNNPNASPPTSFAADAAGSFTTAATVFGGDTSKIVPGSPINSLPCLRINEKGPYDVAPLDAGQAGTGVGTIRVSGTINAASCGFTPSGVDGEIISLTTGLPVGGWTKLALSGSTFDGSIGSIPGSTVANGCYRQSVRLHNSTSFTYVGQFPICIGFSYARVGQSQVVYMTNPTLTGAQLVGNGALVQTVMQLSDTGDVKSNQGEGWPSLVVVDAINNPGGGSTNQLAGDGIVEEAQDLSSYLSGVPVKVVSIAKSGQGSDSWACDYTAQASALAGSGTGAYSVASLYTLADPTQCGGAAATFDGAIGSVNTGSGPQMSVLKGSLTIKDANGAAVASDAAGCADTCNLSSAGAATVTAGTINHLTGQISGLTFSGSQVSPLTASWTLIEDTGSGLYTQQSPYIGFPTWGDSANSASGYVTQVMNQVLQPVSAVLFDQCTADSTSMASATPPANNNSGYPQSWATKWVATLTTKLNRFAGVKAATPVVVLGYARDANATNNVMGCRAALANLGQQGAPSGITSPAPIYYGGSYVDDLTTCTAALCLSPHEGPYVMGGRRMGRRAAAWLAALQKGTLSTVAEPTITGVARVGTTITFTFTLPNGGALTNCGTALSGGSNTPSNSANTCSPPGSPVGTAVYGFKFGLVAGTLYNYEGWSNYAVSTTVDDAKQSTCQIASATTVTCTGAWFTAGMYWTYAGDGPLTEAGTVGPLTVTAGSGYSGTTPFSITATGGGCSTEPVISATQTAGVIGATRTNVGAGCTSNPTFSLAHFTGGSGASVTTTAWLPQDDFNHVGQLLYDNTAGCGGTISAVTYEPGCPVTPVAVPQGPLS